jgi:hypothetical protein
VLIKWNRKILGLIFFTDPSPLNYITEVKDAAGNPVPFPYLVKIQLQKTLLKVFNLDKLNYNTTSNWRRWFFLILRHNHRFSKWSYNIYNQRTIGNYYFLNLSNTGAGENYNDEVPIIQIKKKYVFRNMYRARGITRWKNKFLLRGKYKSLKESYRCIQCYLRVLLLRPLEEEN